MTAAGDKAKLTEAQQRLTNAFIGLVVIISGWAILALAGQFFGYDITVSNPTTISVALPAGIAQNDLLLAVVVNRTNGDQVNV
jgi:hypothetical protein